MTRALRTSLRAALAATLIGLLLSGCGLVGGLGDDELPQELSSSHREDIEKTARAFVDGVGRYNPEIASFATLTPGELGIEEFKRFVLQVGALESAEVPVEFRALGVTSIDAERAVVHATLATTLGNLEVDMVRRGGRWRVASLPDLAIPDAGAPYRVSWAVTNSYTSSSGALVVVGTLENVGDVTLLTLGAGGYIPGADGRAVSTGTAPIIADPFLLGGETTVFRVDLTSEVTAALDPAAFVLVPNFRLAREADARSETPVSVAPKSLTPAEAA
ncbi:MAG: hypothetical protein O3C25_02940, partial [Chloroflexi bacterium]|nr:hypothetical protein [Chloroflexota bacterium]